MILLLESYDNHRYNGHPIPKGTLVAIGGNEDKEEDLEILRVTIELTRKENPSIALITSASAEPEMMKEHYRRAFERIGVGELHHLDITSREEAMEEGNVAVVREADIIFFTGGDQLRITSILGGSPLLREVKRMYFDEAPTLGPSD